MRSWGKTKDCWTVGLRQETCWIMVTACQSVIFWALQRKPRWSCHSFIWETRLQNVGRKATTKV
jgi:hypothetical protein